MKKAWKLAGLGAVLSFLGLAGCTGHSSNTITLRYTAWGGVAETKILQDSADEFTKAHPGVEVQLVRIPWGEYVTKLLTQFSAGAAPDVMLVNCDQLPGFASRGVFEDLKPYVDKDPSFHLADFYPEAVQKYTVKGQLAAIPRNI